MSRLTRTYNSTDLRKLAQARLPKGIFEFIDRGAEDEVALKCNRDSFERIKLQPRMLVDVSGRSARSDILGQTHDMPVAIGPTGAAGLLWYEGELAIAQAAAAANVPFALATGSMTAMEKIADKAGGRLWFQLYMWADRDLSHQLVARARTAGFEGLIVTVDTPALANREYNQRNGFGLPFNPSVRSIGDLLRHPVWLANVLFRYLAKSGLPTYENFPDAHKRQITKGGQPAPLMRSDSLCWDDVKKLRDLWPGKLLVKGIMRADDAVQAFGCGADAVIVSNHGGRNLDSARAPIDVLPEVVAAVGAGRAVMVDGGIRRGSDVVKAMALGAHAVLLGRLPLYGVASAGRAGVSHALTLLKREIELNLAMIGCPAIDGLNGDFLHRPTP